MQASRMIYMAALTAALAASAIGCEVKQKGGGDNKPKRKLIRITSDNDGNIQVKPLKGSKNACAQRAGEMERLNTYAQKYYENAVSNGFRGIRNNNQSGSLRKELGAFLMTFSGLQCDGETTENFQATISRYIEQCEQIL